MYLYVKKHDFLDNFETKDYPSDFYPKELEELGKEILERNFMSKETTYQVGYWRKANAIHKWFVDNCGDGEDTCQRMYVDEEDLKGLLELVNEVLLDHNKASELLPTQSGFFFGTQDYGEWYYEDLKYTKELIEKVLKFVEENKKYQIIYQASW